MPSMLDSNSLTGLMASFFYDHRYLSIPGVGNLHLSEEGAAALTEENHHHTFPPGSISFVRNAREETDPELIEYITARTRKIKALAIADVDSFAGSAKEMLNMRQSYTFPGIATLAPDLHGVIQVFPEKPLLAAYHVKQNLKEHHPAEVTGSLMSDSIVHSERGHRTFGGALIGVISVLIVAGLVYFLFLVPGSQDKESAIKPEKHFIPDPAEVKDQTPSPAQKTPEPALTPKVNSENLDSGGTRYEIVFEEADSTRAFWRYRQLTGWGHKIILHTADSLHYTLAVPYNGPASDTAAAKDSIRILYGHPVYIRSLFSR